MVSGINTRAKYFLNSVFLYTITLRSHLWEMGCMANRREPQCFFTQFKIRMSGFFCKIKKCCFVFTAKFLNV